LKDSLIKRALIVAFIVAFLTWIFYPIYFMVATSFKDNGAAFRYPPEILFKPTLEGFVNALANPTAGQTYRAWGLYFLALAGTALALVLGLPVAFALSHLPLKNKSRTAFSFLTLRMLPPVATLLPLYIMMQRLNLLGTYASMILVYAIFGLPWIVWLMWSFLGAIPHEIYEAAHMDGASNWRILRYVLLPIAKSGLIVSIVFAILEAYNDFAVAFILSSPDTATVPVMLGTLLSERLALWNSIFAVGVLNLIPTFIIMVLVRKHWARALSLGLVK
jgi:ABC-type glycerol-3-phosphate transport system permease component